MVGLLMLLAMTVASWAEGTAEPLGKVVLALDAVDPKIDTMGGGKLAKDMPYYGVWIAEAYKRRTGREMEVREIVAAGGTTTTIDMVLASGERLDAIAGYAGRMSKWAQPAWALPLSDYIPPSDLAQYVDGALAPYYRGGKLYALPATAWLQGINVNVALVRELGMVDKLPKSAWDPWSIADFEAMAKAAKAKGWYALPIFATASSGDYWVQLWLTGFGAELWRDGKVALDSPEGRAGVAWLAKMAEYAPPGAAGLDYNILVSGWKSGKMLAAGGAPGGWTNDFEWRFVLPPSVPGKSGKLIVGPDSSLVFKTTKEPAAAVELVRLMSGPDAQGLWISAAGRYATCKGAAAPVPWGTGTGKDFVGVLQATIDTWASGTRMMQTAGVWDAGIPNSAYSKVREYWQVMLQSVLLGRATVDAAVAKFQADANAFIAAQ
jgi:ABC-type glycerol-3-phosphate transport system substrate-binding protein